MTSTPQKNSTANMTGFWNRILEFPTVQANDDPLCQLEVRPPRSRTAEGLDIVEVSNSESSLSRGLNCSLVRLCRVLGTDLFRLYILLSTSIQGTLSQISCVVLILFKIAHSKTGLTKFLEIIYLLHNLPCFRFFDTSVQCARRSQPKAA